jgi:hypothetical protein
VQRFIPDPSAPSVQVLRPYRFRIEGGITGFFG